MQILHVNLARGFRGGERQTLLLIRELSRLGHRQGLVCRKDSPMRTHLADVEGVYFIQASNQLGGHFSGFNADIVHAHEARAVHWAFLHHLLKRIPYVITRRVDVPVKNRLLNRFSYSRAVERVAISGKIRTLLQQRGWGRVVLIPSASARLQRNPDVTAAFRAQFEGRFLVGHAGALVDKHKGQGVLIEAARLLNGRYPDIHVVFFGQGEDETRLKAAAAGLDNVTWMGFKSNIGDYLQGLDLFVFPSRNEGLGSTLLDVMDAGVPIIASDVGGIPDIIHPGQTGVLVPVGEASALADAIETLYLDPALRQQLVKGASRLLQDYVPELMAERYQALYRQVVTPENQEIRHKT